MQLGHVKIKAYTLTLIMVLSLFFACPAFSALTVTGSPSVNAGINITDTDLASYGYIAHSVGVSNTWMAVDFGINQTVASCVLFSSSPYLGADFPRTIKVQYTASPVLTTADGNAAIWTDLTTVSNIAVGSIQPVSFGFGSSVTVRAIRFYFPQPTTHIRTYFGSVWFSGLSALSDSPMTADTINAINAIRTTTNTTQLSFANYSTKYQSALVQANAVNAYNTNLYQSYFSNYSASMVNNQNSTIQRLDDLLSSFDLSSLTGGAVDNTDFLYGLSGIASAFVVLSIWGRNI